MASLTITVPNAVVPRIRAAFGTNPDPVTGVRTPAADADLIQALKDHAKAVVTAYEAGLANIATYTNVGAEQW